MSRQFPRAVDLETTVCPLQIPAIFVDSTTHILVIAIINQNLDMIYVLKLIILHSLFVFQ